MSVIAEIGGKKWALGMHWRSYGVVPGRSDLLDDAAELDAPWYVLRNSEAVIQAGYCAPVADIKRPRKLASLAATLAEVREQPWLGRFEIAPELYWFIAVRDNFGILPNGDVIGTFDEVEAARSEVNAFGGWTTVEGDLSTLEGLLAEAESERPRKKRLPVHSLAVSRIDPVPTAIVGAIVLLLGGAVAVAHHFHVQDQLEHKRKAIAARLKETAKPPVPTAQQRLQRTPTPTSWLSTCFAGLSAMPESDHGWMLVERGCTSDGTVGKWVRGPGAGVSEGPAGQRDLAGESITSATPFASRPANGTDAAPDRETGRYALLTWSQRYEIPTRFDAPQRLSPDAPAGWATNVEIRMPVSPFSTDHGLDNIPGLRITQLTLSPATSGSGVQWTIQGVMYARD